MKRPRVICSVLLGEREAFRPGAAMALLWPPSGVLEPLPPAMRLPHGDAITGEVGMSETFVAVPGASKATCAEANRDADPPGLDWRATAAPRPLAPETLESGNDKGPSQAP
jgi:hypothetical protein